MFFFPFDQLAHLVNPTDEIQDKKQKLMSCDSFQLMYVTKKVRLVCSECKADNLSFKIKVVTPPRDAELIRDNI